MTQEPRPAQAAATSRALRITTLLLALAIAGLCGMLGSLNLLGQRTGLLALLWLWMPIFVQLVFLHVLLRQDKVLWPWCAIALLASGVEILILVDALYWHPDPQGGLAILVAPVVSLASILVLAPFAWWMAQPGHNQHPD